MTTAAELTPEQRQAYIRALRLRFQQADAQADKRLAQRRARAWSVAREAASKLREQYGASRVVVFGSLARGDGFSVHSDLDLAAWGLAPSRYYEALARVMDLDGDLGVDLVRGEDCSARLLELVERDGVPV